VPPLRAALAKRDWRALRSGLGALKRKHPFDAGTLLPRTGHARAAAPRRSHPPPGLRRLPRCAGRRHAAAGLQPLRTGKRTPREEFAARLLIGVRGDRSTAWRNPFSDLELGALLAYYENGKTGGRP
jgi:hypothetical protein